ncbi:hypothetical protein [Clavibacter sp. VKM Ac-2872]|uniref:hypothetical protein n=1 Tax=Clavibacter sp. VKM Ac-2872 TaxID=2783812 RepID=UPI00188BEF6C|nr:hypothetical protein [Clavibacter sp. VKM Ac-2872]MBF4624021.1 hypothetical protein [Clavibacter sp. VKM Ac-2872]
MSHARRIIGYWFVGSPMLDIAVARFEDIDRRGCLNVEWQWARVLTSESLGRVDADVRIVAEPVKAGPKEFIVDSVVNDEPFFYRFN